MRHLLSLTLAFALTGTVLAAPAPHASHAHAGHAAPSAPRPTFDALDVDKDGRLDKAEMARHPLAAHMAMADADRNGTLDRREFATLSAM